MFKGVIAIKDLRIRHIVLLEEYELDFNEYKFIKEDAESYTFHYIATGKEVVLRR